MEPTLERKKCFRSLFYAALSTAEEKAFSLLPPGAGRFFPDPGRRFLSRPGEGGLSSVGILAASQVIPEAINFMVCHDLGG